MLKGRSVLRPSTHTLALPVRWGLARGFRYCGRDTTRRYAGARAFSRTLRMPLRGATPGTSHSSHIWSTIFWM